MSNQPDNEKIKPDTTEYSKVWIEIAEKSQRLISEFVQRQQVNAKTSSPADPLNIGNAFLEMTRQMMTNPAKIAEAQVALWQSHLLLWESTTKRMSGEAAEPIIEPVKGDFRFKDADWEENALFDFIKQSYLLTSQWMQKTVSDVEGLDDKTAQKVDFYTRQFADALAPSNFVVTNPKVLRETIETGGRNLVNGLDNLLQDLENSKDQFRIKMVEEDAFEVGVDLAITPGKVVYQNDLLQLIQYEPTTEKVFKTPLLIIPPWINKYYILDLREKNSFIKWAVAQGLTVFVVSWVNPDEKLADKSFDDYMRDGPLDCLAAVEKATGEGDINVVGYCLGGTLLAATLAHMARSKKKKKNKQTVKSATFLATMVDFEQAGELGVFIDEEQLTQLEAKMNKRGYLEGGEMAATFNMLRANDLIWSFVVNNYLMGKAPFPFDLLYWNSDSTRMPAAMHSYYLRNMYLENKLVQPDELELCGTPIDLTRIETPAFILSTRDDHIAPWKSTYAATQLYKGPVKFCLAASGHIAGVVNHPAAEKYSYWTNPKKPEIPENWLEGAVEHSGSWWPEWEKWLKKFGGDKVDARIPGDYGLEVIEPAPGSFALVRLR
ncbi:MAG: class I poly(R)-hydroxyalkanoic acid synthase [Rhodospirillaceae bacterium]|nr:class I poly(R)-hydroxyalkanoic acid synthase [Rhodospirillaceae bacterium]